MLPRHMGVSRQRPMLQPCSQDIRNLQLYRQKLELTRLSLKPMHLQYDFCSSPGVWANSKIDKDRPGGEAMAQCSNHNDDWCCNADNVNVKCCQESPAPRPFFQLQDGRPYATIGRNQASSAPVLSSITGLASESGGGSQPSRTPEPDSSTAGNPSSRNAAISSRPSASPTPVSVSQSVSSGPNGQIVTVPVTIYATPTPGANTNSPSNSGSGSGSGSNLGVIIGCAVGIPLALALLGILIWLLRKRRTQKKTAPYKDSPEMDGSSVSPAFAGGKLGKDVYRHSQPGTSEIDGAPIGATRPVSNVPGHAELPSGTGFQAGNGPAFAPDTVGLGGGNGDGRATWGSAPPRYSPGMNQGGFAHPPNAMELADTSIMPVINEKEGAQQYQAYRPSQAAAELPTVKTPPEDLEKQVR